MISLNANGKYEDFVNGLARTGASANEGEEQKFNEAFRNFVEEVKDIYSDNSVFNVQVNGTADHGGAQVIISFNVFAYPAGKEVTEHDEKGEVKVDSKGNQTAMPKAAETKLGEFE
jgi:hypothetical protein